MIKNNRDVIRFDFTIGHNEAHAHDVIIYENADGKVAEINLDIEKNDNSQENWLPHLANASELEEAELSAPSIKLDFQENVLKDGADGYQLAEKSKKIWDIRKKGNSLYLTLKGEHKLTGEEHNILLENFYFQNDDEDTAIKKCTVQAEFNLYDDDEIFEDNSAATFQYQYQPIMLKAPLHPIVNASTSPTETFNRSSALVNDGSPNYLFLQLINTSGQNIDFEKGAEWTLSFSYNQNQPFAISDNQTIAHQATLSCNLNSNTNTSNKFNISTINRKKTAIADKFRGFHIKVTEAISIAPQGYLELRLFDIKTTLSPRIGLIFFQYEGATGYMTEDITFEIPVQPMVMEKVDDTSRMRVATTKGCSLLNGGNLQINNPAGNKLVYLGLSTAASKFGSLELYNSETNQRIVKLAHDKSKGSLRLYNGSAGDLKSKVFLGLTDNAGEFVLSNSDNKKVIDLKTSENQERLQINNDKGEERVWLGSYNNDGALGLNNAKTKRVIDLKTSENQERLQINNDKGEERVWLGSYNNDGALLLHNEHDKETISLADGRLITRNLEGTVDNVYLGNGKLQINNSEGKQLLQLGASPDNNQYGSLLLHNSATGQSIVRLAHNDDKGSLQLYNGAASNKQMVYLGQFLNAGSLILKNETNDEKIVELGRVKEKYVRLYINNPEGDMRTWLGSGDNNGDLGLINSENKNIILLNRFGNKSVQINNSEGKQLVQLGANPKDSKYGLLELYNSETTKQVVQLGQIDKDHIRLNINNSEGKQLVQLGASPAGIGMLKLFKNKTMVANFEGALLKLYNLTDKYQVVWLGVTNNNNVKDAAGDGYLYLYRAGDSGYYPSVRLPNPK